MEPDTMSDVCDVAPAGFSIRPAEPADVPAVLGFVHKLAEYERLSHEVLMDEAALHGLLFGARPYAEVVLAEVDGQAIGFALFFHTVSTFAGKPGIYLEDLFVDPQARGKGYGKELMVHLAHLAIERGCARFEWSVLKWNEPSIAFYRQLGAKPLKTWDVFRLSGAALDALGGKVAP
jgi:GNAT superfamily N-acetyltransferase